MTRLRHLLRRDRPAVAGGQALVLFALLLPVLAGITGLAIDGGNLYFQRRKLQSIADAAALTGAQRANFNADAPEILDDGKIQARMSAYTNGATAADALTVNKPPAGNPATLYYAGKPDYIEVILERDVRNPFMNLFGFGTTRVQARAVARCVKPGYGDPAVLALGDDPDAITFNGGSSSAVSVFGDVVSHGGIDPNGNASHFQITGGAYALGEPAAPNLTTTLGSFGDDSDLALWDVPDPLVQGMNAKPTPTVVWPYSNFTTLSNGAVKVCDGPWGPWPGESGNCPDGTNPNNENINNVTINSGKYARFKPGYYGRVSIHGHAQFAPGVYSVSQLDLGSNGTLTDDTSKGRGVLIHIRGNGGGGMDMDVSGGAQFTLQAIQPNAWQNVVIYCPNGDVDMTGNGNREVIGSVYVPNGNAAISGDGGDAIVKGRVIAETVTFSGNGPTVNYGGAGQKPTFGPIIVNTPDRP